MKRTCLILVVMILALVFTRSVSAQTDSCALLKAEAEALLAKADQAKTPDDAKSLKQAAQFYIDPCAKAFSENDMVKLWGYDAAAPNELLRWAQYGGEDPKWWSVVGQGDLAYFQGTDLQTSKLRLGATLKVNGFNVSNIVTYTYQGQIDAMYAVLFPDKFRALPLLNRGRTTSTFLDPLTGDTVVWQGNLRTLQHITTPGIAVEITFRVRLDTPQSFVKPYISNTVRYVAVQVSEAGVSVEDSAGKQNEQQATERSPATPTVPAAVTVKSGDWYTLRLLVQSNRMQAYLDLDKIADVPLDNFEINDRVFAGFGTSSTPASISINDIQFKTNWTSAR